MVRFINNFGKMKHPNVYAPQVIISNLAHSTFLQYVVHTPTHRRRQFTLKHTQTPTAQTPTHRCRQ